MKICTKCKAEKYTSEFSKNSLSKDGLQRWCKPCKAEQERQPNSKARKKECSRKKHEVMRERNKEHCKERLKAFPRKRPKRKYTEREELRPKYVAWLMTKYDKTLNGNDLPKELIELKTIQLKIKRLLKVKQ